MRLRKLRVEPACFCPALGSQWIGQPVTMEPTGMKRSLFLGFDIQKDKLIQGKRERFKIGNFGIN